MNYLLAELFSYSVGIGALIGLIRIRKIDRAFLPFIVLLWSGLLNEIITTVLINRYGSNAINSNIYVLVESLLITWLFYRLNLFAGHRWFYFAVLLFFGATWLTDNFILSSITRFNSYFRIAYSFSVVLMSIHLLNRQLAISKMGLLKNSVFLICMGFIIFFTYKALVEIFWVYGLNASKSFRVEVYRIMAWINLFVNLIYAIAVLWIPVKRRFTLL